MLDIIIKWEYWVAILGGIVAGFVNTLAGSGSAITLSILVELFGIPPNIANGTNRMGILATGLVGNTKYLKEKKTPLNSISIPIIVVTVLGAIGGIYVATIISDDQFREVFKYLLILTLVSVFVKPKRWLREQSDYSPTPLCMYLVYVAIGFYGGFIQMGMGVFFLIAIVLGSKFNMVQGNGVKLLAIFIYTILALAVFSWNSQIDWRIGSILAVGQMIGAYFAAKFATESELASKWMYRLLILIIIITIIRLFL